jgi:hypothetical protein
MNSVTPVKHNFKLSTRKYTLSTNNNFKIPSIGLIQSLKLLNYSDLIEKYNHSKIQLLLQVGNFPININDILNISSSSIEYETNDTTREVDTPNDTIDIKKIREYIRNIDYPETDYENKLLNFEQYLFSQQLKCTEHYYTISNKDLQNSLFTSGVNVYVIVRYIDIENNQIVEINDDLVIEETYFEKILK